MNEFVINAKEIQDWLIAYIAELLQVAPDIIDIHKPFSNYGLSSLDAVTLSGELEEKLGRRLSPTLAYEYSTILALSKYLAINEESKKPESPANQMKGRPAEPIAVIGMSCRFPGANDPDSFWQILSEGINTISEIPGDRWPKKAFYDPDPAAPGKSVSYWGGFLNNIDHFDPFFFGISPKEAKYMDPQQRLLLELSHEAIDDAGKTKCVLDGSDTGVFIGISVNEYSTLQFNDPLLITSHSGTGSALSIAANRISYFFNFRGPSIAIDTACSSSLSAVHLACQSLRSGECKTALAGGVNMILSPASSIAFTKAGVLAPDGRCKTFDARANGYVRGEGGGVIVLKPLSSALADGDHVHAIIAGSAMAQDGRTNGLMAPSQESQENLLRATYQAAGISPGSVQYVEAHGTGTLLGDSMEAAAIGAVIGSEQKQGPCAIGSVKTNIGHLEAAAGMAGLIKVILSIQHRTIPPSLHYQSPNPHIPFKALNIHVQNEIKPWPSGPAIAGVSSFGFGGTNVHVVVQEAVQDNKDQEEKRENSIEANYQLLPLSASSHENLQSLAGSFRELLITDIEVSIKDICCAAAERRSQQDYRLAVVGKSRQELSESLHAFVIGERHPNILPTGIVPDRQSKLAFIFPGQGGQWLGMGRELLKKEHVFFMAIERIDKIILAQYGWSLMNVFCAEESESRFEEIDVTQPTLFAIQVALTALWKSWGIVPDAVAGHSMGEIAAAQVAGMLTLEDAVKVVCTRSQLLKSLRGKGSMLMTELSPDQAKELLKESGNDVVIAAINGPASTVLSGSPAAIKEVMNSLQVQNLFCKLINVDVASHCPQMDAIRAELLLVLDGLNPKPPNLPFYSTVTGGRGDDLNFNALYWVDNLRKPVLFSDAVGHLLDDGHTFFIEIGPHPILLSSIQQSLLPRDAEISLLPSLRREEPEREVLLRTLGALYTQGFSISWDKLYSKGGNYVHLPPISWQRQRYWIDVNSTSSKTSGHWTRAADRHAHPLLGERIDLASSGFVWQTILDDQVLSFLGDHRVADEIIFPAAAYIEMALQAAAETGLNKSHELADFVFEKRMVLENGKPRPIQALLVTGQDSSYMFSIYSRIAPEEKWMLYASTSFIKQPASDGLQAPTWEQPVLIRKHCRSQFTGEAFYKTVQLHGVQYGPSFQGIQQVWNKENESLARIVLPDALNIGTDVYQIHPALLDACLQVLAATQITSFENALYLPAGCKSIRFYSKPAGVLWSHAALRPEPHDAADIITADIRLLDENEQTVAELIGFRLQRVSQRCRPLLSRQDTWLYQLRWQEQPGPVAANIIFSGKKHWLIFADAEGVGAALAKQLEASGDACKLLQYKDVISDFETSQEGALPEIVENLLKEISSPLYGVIHLWSLSTVLPSSAINGYSDGVQLTSCNSVLLLVQALARRIAGLPRLWLVTRGAKPVKQGETIAVEQSPLWGLGKVISFELPELKCTRVDLDIAQSNTEAASLLFKQLSIDDGEDQVAFRSGTRFVLRLLPFLPEKSVGSTAVSLRADGTYLITGGLGGLGLATAKWMASRGARHLVLLGRTEPSPTATIVADQLREEGVEVLIVKADVSNRAQLKEVFEKMEQNMPVLRGVAHAAGVLDDGSLLDLNAVRMNSVMAPKVDGTWNLHQATLNLPLDFFVLFSSAVSVLGSPGQGNYAVASSYLDAMAYYRRHLGLPAISINWGPWAEVGLAAIATEKLKEKNASTQHLVKVIKIDQGLEILEALLTQSAPQVVVLPFDLKNLIELYPTAAGMPFFAEVGGKDIHVARLYSRPKLRQQYVAPRNEIERKLAEMWRQTLHIDRVGVHDSFFELGGDSVLAAQIVTLAQKSFGIRINPQEAFKAFTIERLAEMLAAEILSRVEEMSEDEVQRLLSK